MGSFEYTHLRSGDSFRLFKFLPWESQPDRGRDVAVSLTEVRISEKPTYRALSYTWGDLKDTLSISVENGSLHVTTNLHAFLRQLQSRENKSDGEKWFWADQICINQHDTSERNQQVPLMGDIYRLSQESLVWLGKTTEHMQDVTTVIQSIETLGIDSRTPVSEAIGKATEKLESKITDTSQSLFSNLTSFLNLSYFTRAWCIQEVAVAKSCTIVIESNILSDFRWETLDLLILALAMLDRKNSGTVFGSQVLKTRAAATIRHIQFCRKQRVSQNMRKGQEHFLQVLRRLAFATECSDPRDLVYAFLALQPKIIIQSADYSITVEETYIRASARLAESSEDLSIFGWVRFDPSSSLPSWVVDWRIQRGTQGSPIADTGSRFNACGKYKFKPAQSYQSGSVMKVRGKVVDSIETLAHKDHFQHRDSTSIVSELQSHKIIGDFDSLCEKVSDTKSNLHQRLIKALFAHSLREDDLDNWVHKLLAMLAAWQHHVDRDIRIEESLSKEQRDIIRKLPNHASLCRSRRLFVSRDNFSFGLAPRDAQPGDLVCILHGSAAPVVLRLIPTGRYLVIGQTYFEDWMFGKHIYWEEDEADSFELE